MRRQYTLTATVWFLPLAGAWAGAWALGRLAVRVVRNRAVGIVFGEGAHGYRIRTAGGEPPIELASVSQRSQDCVINLNDNLQQSDIHDSERYLFFYTVYTIVDNGVTIFPEV